MAEVFDAEAVKHYSLIKDAGTPSTLPRTRSHLLRRPGPIFWPLMRLSHARAKGLADPDLETAAAATVAKGRENVPPANLGASIGSTQRKSPG
jgi:hypothetical protein